MMISISIVHVKLEADLGESLHDPCCCVGVRLLERSREPYVEGLERVRGIRVSN